MPKGRKHSLAPFFKFGSCQGQIGFFRGLLRDHENLLELAIHHAILLVVATSEYILRVIKGSGLKKHESKYTRRSGGQKGME